MNVGIRLTRIDAETLAFVTLAGVLIVAGDLVAAVNSAAPFAHGSWLAAYLVRDPHDVPGIATLGPDPLADEFSREAFGELLAGRRSQIKGLLRDQGFIAGVGNAYSDEILHVAWHHLAELADAYDDLVADVLAGRRRLPAW